MAFRVLFWEICYTSGVYFSLKCVDLTFAPWLHTHKVDCRIGDKKKTWLKVCTMSNAARTCWISPHWVRISGNTRCIHSCTCSNTRRKCVMCRFNSHNNTAGFTVTVGGNRHKWLKDKSMKVTYWKTRPRSELQKTLRGYSSLEFKKNRLFFFPYF